MEAVPIRAPASVALVSETVETERLRLRPWRPDDLEPLAQIFAKPPVWHFPFRRGFSEDQTRAFLEHRLAAQDEGVVVEWAAEDRESGKLLGYVGLSLPTWFPDLMPAVEVGWRLDPGWWGKGLATEGGRAALDHGFRVLQLDEILAIYEPENVASGRVMERLGMHVQRDTVDPTRGLPLRIYVISRAEWSNHGSQ